MRKVLPQKHEDFPRAHAELGVVASVCDPRLQHDDCNTADSTDTQRPASLAHAVACLKLAGGED